MNEAVRLRLTDLPFRRFACETSSRVFLWSAYSHGQVRSEHARRTWSQWGVLLGMIGMARFLIQQMTGPVVVGPVCSRLLCSRLTPHRHPIPSMATRPVRNPSQPSVNCLPRAKEW